MQEIRGNLWDFHGKENIVICITTNGFVKNNGECVMGRGCAWEAACRNPALPRRLGTFIRENGNIPHMLTASIMSFPVKHAWWEKADMDLIAASSRRLREVAEQHPELTYILPRPGCGNGHLNWVDVRRVIVDILPDNVSVITF